MHYKVLYIGKSMISYLGKLVSIISQRCKNNFVRLFWGIVMTWSNKKAFETLFVKATKTCKFCGGLAVVLKLLFNLVDG